MIADEEIRNADPAAVIKQYEPYIQKLANRYLPVLSRTGAVDMDDLIQVGRIAIAEAQLKYDPDSGSFMNLLFYCVRYAMRRTLGFNNQTGAPPVSLVYLDTPISEDSDASLGDTIPDPNAVPLDEPITEEETRRETSEEIRAALGRMKSDKQRKAVSLVWLEGKTRQAAADDMEMNHRAFYSLEEAGRSALRRDWRLKEYAREMPFFHVGVSRFNSTWTSATEEAVLWREKRFADCADDMDDDFPERRCSPMQRLANIENLRRKLATYQTATAAPGGHDLADVQTSIMEQEQAGG